MAEENGTEDAPAEVTSETVSTEQTVKEVKTEFTAGDEVLKEAKTEVTAGDEVVKDPKTELTAGDEISELEKNIIRQVEYYFGDNNLPRDKFLQEQIKLDDGWVSLTVLLTFKRLSSMTTNQEVIIKALLKSTNDLLEISEDRSKIRRSLGRPIPQMNEERRAELVGRTLYVKGFPLDSKLDSILDFFKNYDFVENVIMRTYVDKATKEHGFKGSVFATFAKKEQAEKFLEIEKVTYLDQDLVCMFQNDYYKMKKSAGKPKNNPSNNSMNDTLRPPNGTVIHLEGLPENATREDIKEVFIDLDAEIAYVDYQKGDKAGWIRLHNEDSAKEIIKKIKDGKLEICKAEVTTRLLEGEEETKFLDKVVEDIKNRRQKMEHNRRGGRGNRGGRGGGKGGRGGWNNRKRKADNENGAPPSKH
uniref:Putative rna-binding protein la n=1 Tax=Xenopsylla cheopis TaxID=163159 RepID=A0A6M2DCZ8_XENCH